MPADLAFGMRGFHPRCRSKMAIGSSGGMDDIDERGWRRFDSVHGYFD